MTQTTITDEVREPARAKLPPSAEAAGRARAVGSRLSVAVLVDLVLEPEAGGHVKCWERIAEAALAEPGLDLTIYFLGKKNGEILLSDNVRYVIHKPLLSTEWFDFLAGMPDHTDLAPLHFGLKKRLRRHHVLHTTDAFFAMSQTALRFARRGGRPLVNSIHTDMPGYTRVYSRRVLERILGGNRLGRRILEQWHLHERFGAMMHRRLERYARKCDWVMGNDTENANGMKSVLPGGRFSILRRGIDKDVFHPRRRDRERLFRTFGIPHDSAVLLFAGRLDPDKSVMTKARAARLLLDQGVPVRLVFAGEGTQKEEIRDLLGDHASLPGAMSQDELAWIYASADLFVFPSPHEISPNVVLEAKGCGLPVVVSSRGGSGQFVDPDENDGIVVESDSPQVWAGVIESLLGDPQRRRAMGAAARRSIEEHWPSWRDVLREDLLPVWQRVAREKGFWQG